MTQLLRKRQIVSILLTLTMLFMLWPGMAWAEGEDTTPPEWQASFPKASSVSDKEVNLEVMGNETGTAYFVRLADGDPAPTSQQVQAGQDASGAALDYPQAGSIAVHTGGSSLIRVRGLTPNTPYDIYTVLEDEAGNLQATPERVEITTTVPSDAISGITKVEPGEAGNKEITVYVTVKNTEGIGSRGYSAADFSITVDDGTPTTFASAPLFSDFRDPDSDGLYYVTLTGDADNKEYTLTNLTVSGVVIESGPYAIKTPPPALDKPSITKTVYDKNEVTTLPGYHTYSDDNSTVWVMDIAGPTGTAVWNYRSPLPSPNLIENIKYIEGRYMAVGNNSTLLTSENGISWTKVNLGTDIDRLGGIAYGGGKYVIVGYVDISYGAARIYTSDDGVNWHQTAAVPHHYLYDVAYGNGKFVAVGRYGKILVSTDGETWVTKPVTYPGNQRTTLLSITYSEAMGKFVAAGMGGTTADHEGGIMTSEDGENWMVTYSNPSYVIWDIACGNGILVAVGGRNTGAYFIVTSNDGESWTQRSTSWSANARLYSVEFDGNKFVAAGSTQSGNWAFTTSSTNGISWSDKDIIGLPGFSVLASNGSRLAAMGGYGNIYTSDNDGTSWDYRTLGTARTLMDVAWNGSDLYVAVGVEGIIQTSTNGITWNPQPSGTTYDLNKVDYLNGQFIAVGKNGTILTSANGTDWTTRTSGTMKELKGLAYGGGKYVVVGGDSSFNPVILTSDDGASWSDNTSGLINRSFVAVAYGDGAFLALMNYGQAYRYSVDPDTGEFVHTPAADLPGSGNYPTDIIYAGGKFAVVGGYGKIYLSSDKGENWTVIESKPDSYFRGITYGGGNLAAVGELGKIMGSADGGTTWFVQPSGLKPNHYSSDNYIRLNGITAGDNCFVAVGENGLVLQSVGFTVSTDRDAHDVAIIRTALDINNILGSGSNENAGLIKADMNLPTTFTIMGPIEANITWTSSKPQYVATDGKVTRPNASDGDQVVFLTATVYKGSASSTKEFGVVVLAQASNDSGDVDSAYAALTFDTIKGSNTAANNIVSNLNLITSGTNGTTIGWVSDKPAYIAADGTVTRPAQGAADEVVTLTATITKGSATKTKTFTLTVKALVDADAQDVADAKAALTFKVIKESNTAANNIVSNLNLITTGLNGTAINWTSDKPAYIAANGTVTRPAPGAADEVVTLTAAITKGTASDTKTFTMTVKALVDADAQDVEDAKAALTFDTIKGSNTAANNIVSNLNLTTTGLNGTAISWTSDKPGYIAANGTVTRPAQGAADEVVTLTAVITKGTASDTKTFTLTVTAIPSSTNGSGGGGGGGSSAPSGILVTPAGRNATDTGVSLSFPAGAVESDIRIQINEASLTAGISLPADSKLLSKIVDIVKDKSGHFSKPVTITMSFDKSKIDLAKYEIGIYYYDEAKGEWVELDNIEVNLTASTVTGQVNHFTKFAVIATLKAAAEEQPPLPPTPDLPTDIADHWAKESIVRLINNGVLSGYPDGSFKPDKTVTRAEFVVMLVNAFKMQSQSGANFTDTSNHWARDSIAVALAHGIVSGLDKNTFGPDHYITREQAAVMTAQAAKLPATATELTFIDSQQIAPWAKSSVAAAVNSKVLTGYPDNSFQPKGKLTRAEAAAIIAKLL